MVMRQYGPCTVKSALQTNNQSWVVFVKIWIQNVMSILNYLQIYLVYRVIYTMFGHLNTYND